MRIFVGVWPSPAVREALDDLGRPAVPGLRWTTTEQWHVTLRFCGEVPDAEVASLARALEVGLDGQSPVPATTGPATARFGRSGILHLPVAGLDGVARRVRWASGSFGDHHENRPFHGHLTLARARRGLPGHLVGRAVDPVTWPVDEVAIVASTRTSGGARYETVARLALAG